MAHEKCNPYLGLKSGREPDLFACTYKVDKSKLDAFVRLEEDAVAEREREPKLYLYLSLRANL